MCGQRRCEGERLGAAQVCATVRRHLALCPVDMDALHNVALAVSPDGLAQEVVPLEGVYNDCQLALCTL